MNLYIVRHGESVGNKARTYQFSDMGLSPDGISQAKAIAQRVKGLSIDLIYASNLKRAQETAGIIAGEAKLPIETWEDIREFRRPTDLSGKHVDSPESRAFEKAFEKNYKNPDWKYSDDETFNEIKARTARVLTHLVEKHRDQNVLLVSHGTFIKMLAAYVVFREKLTSEMFWDFRHHSFAGNTGVSICEYTDRHGWRLLSWNDMSHL